MKLVTYRASVEAEARLGVIVGDQVLDAEAVIADYDRLQFRSSLYPQLFLEGSATRGEDLEGTPRRSARPSQRGGRGRVRPPVRPG